MNVTTKNLGQGIKNVIINDPKTYNSLSYKTLNQLLKVFKKLGLLEKKDPITKITKVP